MSERAIRDAAIELSLLLDRAAYGDGDKFSVDEVEAIVRLLVAAARTPTPTPEERKP